MRLSNGEVLLAWPLAQHIITQGWFYNDGSLHQAVDLRTQIDNMYIRPVYAAEDGTVDQTQDWDGHTKTGMQSYGNMVRIKHAPYKGKPLQTRYAHLSRYCVKLGQQVKEGDLIGYSGTTGNVFGAHSERQPHQPAGMARRRFYHGKQPGVYIPSRRARSRKTRRRCTAQRRGSAD